LLETTEQTGNIYPHTADIDNSKKGKTNLDFTEARDSEWQWHQLGHMQVCISFQTVNHANTSLLSFLQAGCPSCRPTNSVKALKAQYKTQYKSEKVNNLKYSKTKLQNYPGSVASYNTRPGNEVGLFYNAPKPTWGCKLCG